jgi:predicted ester cyclase
MSLITETASKFFEACESGKGWEQCAQYCHSDATFSAQAEPLTEVSTVEGYTNWVNALYGFVENASYELKSFATDAERNSVVAFAVFSGTHTGEGGPVPPTGRSTSTDYVYVMDFDGDKIAHMTKIWHSGLAMQELGWA